jgi:DNA (cytosine-5)-methyltransferase 1
MVESIKGKKLNKGEWAEFYVMLKLLGEGRLYTANKLLQKNYKSYLDVLKVIRQECSSQVLEYIIDEEKSLVVIKPQDSDTPLATISTKEFDNNAKILFDGIKDIKGSSVPAPDSVCEFAKVIYVSKPKAPAVKALKKQFGGKNDIFIEVRDGQTSIVSVMGFSIKSKFGHNPTLFNAGSSSQFLYKLTGCNDNLMQEFNLITEKGGRGWSKCKEYLTEHEITMEFTNPKNPIYNDNLFLIRESMSKIMAWCVKDRLIDSQKDYEVMETVERMTAKNPLKVPNPKIYYEKAIKDFLMAGFTGMTAGKPWDGKEQVNGGYISVMDDGDVLCYHSNDRETFRDYLYRNTHFEYVSADKYVWSRIEKTDGEYYLPLNVSVRFNTHIR